MATGEALAHLELFTAEVVLFVPQIMAGVGIADRGRTDSQA
jgi:hypothetical protein